MAKFDGDLWKTNEVAAPQSHEILQTFVMWENKFANVCKFLQICEVISSQPRPQGAFPWLWRWGGKSALASAGHMTTKHPEFVGVLN